MSAKTREKLTPPPCQGEEVVPPPPLSVRTHYKFRKIRSFCTKKCGRPHLKNPLVRKMSALDNPHLSDRGSWTALDNPHLSDRGSCSHLRKK